MKWYGIIAALCLALLGGSGLLYWRALEPVLAVGTTAELARATVAVFSASHRPLAVLPAPIGSGDGIALELMDPSTSLPTTHLHEGEEIRALYQLSDSCVEPVRTKPESDALRKAWAFARFACNEAGPLADEFFERPPFMHPSGRSFVVMAVELGQAPYRDNGWLERHAAQVHVLESDFLRRRGIVPGATKDLLSKMSRQALAALLAGEAAALTDSHAVFLEQRAAMSEGMGEYRFYERALWDEVVDRSPVVLATNAPASLCEGTSDLFCWVPNKARASMKARLYGGIAVASLVTLVVTLAVLLANRIRAQRREREDRARVLRTLTHELRTPAASLTLALEALRGDFDVLPTESQGAFLRMCDDLQRLNRVIATSARYLRATGGKRGDRYALKDLESFNEFLEATLDPYRAQIRIVPLAEDRGLRTDPHWLQVCLVNLVENALRHGKPEVAVVALADRGGLVIRVSDGGSLGHAGIADLMRSAAREPRPASGGLGLGLGLVVETLRDLGGELVLEPSPTTFVMRLRKTS